MAVSGQDLDGLWLYDDHDMDVYLFAFWFPPPLLRGVMHFSLSLASYCLLLRRVAARNATVYSMRWGCSPRARLGVYYFIMTGQTDGRTRQYHTTVLPMTISPTTVSP
jgi:hypothetical protein